MADTHQLIELAIEQALSGASRDAASARVVARLKAVRENLCADPACHRFCQVGCRDEKRG